MAINWQVLHGAGVPLAGPRDGRPPDVAEVVAAVGPAITGPLSPRERESLVAFLAAWRDHWPQAWQTAFGTQAGTVSAWVDRSRGDEGTFIKLRRIALANLATVL